MRVFLAIDITDQAKKEIEKLYKVLKRKHWPVKWEEPEKIHLTLAFLANINNSEFRVQNSELNSESKIKLIKKAVKEACENISPFEISFKGLGCFPDYDQPRVIWLGLKGDLKSLAKLQKNVCAEIIKIAESLYDCTPKRILMGLRRSFSAHITLGRIKKARFREKREIGRQLKKLRICDLQSKTLIDRVVIYESKLSRLGSRYRKLEEISLK